MVIITNEVTDSSQQRFWAFASNPHTALERSTSGGNYDDTVMRLFWALEMQAQVVQQRTP